MYVDAVVMNKIKIYFKTLQIHFIFHSYTFLINNNKKFHYYYLKFLMVKKVDNHCSIAQCNK